MPHRRAATPTRILYFLVISITNRIMRACHNSPMNSRNILVIIAAILVPGGILLLAPVIYRWVKQRKPVGTAAP